MKEILTAFEEEYYGLAEVTGDAGYCVIKFYGDSECYADDYISTECRIDIDDAVFGKKFAGFLCEHDDLVTVGPKGEMDFGDFCCALGLYDCEEE